MKTCIIIDSSIYFAKNQFDHFKDVFILPFVIQSPITKKDHLLNFSTLDEDEFSKIVYNREPAKSSTPTLRTIESTLKEAYKKFDFILILTVKKDFSSCFNHIEIVKNKIDKDKKIFLFEQPKLLITAYLFFLKIYNLKINNAEKAEFIKLTDSCKTDERIVAFANRDLHKFKKSGRYNFFFLSKIFDKLNVVLALKLTNSSPGLFYMSKGYKKLFLNYKKRIVDKYKKETGKKFVIFIHYAVITKEKKDHFVLLLKEIFGDISIYFQALPRIFGSILGEKYTINCIESDSFSDEDIKSTNYEKF